MQMQRPQEHKSARIASIRLGSVSFLNAKPLIYGLKMGDDLSMSLEVPSGLLARLQRQELDVALLPVIDYQRMKDLRILTSGGIGCDGPTLTVRIFSKEPIGQITILACDTDSHTSVALARIVLAALYNVKPKLVDLDEPAMTEGVARLLIGDKVVCEEPRGFPYQLDLGEAWKRLTGLPFVFAVWMARADVDLGDLPQQLEAAKGNGLAHVREIIQMHAIPRGWPGGVARQYLTQHLQFDIGVRQIEAIRLFYRLAYREGLIDHQPWQLRF